MSNKRQTCGIKWRHRHRQSKTLASLRRRSL